MKCTKCRSKLDSFTDDNHTTVYVCSVCESTFVLNTEGELKELDNENQNTMPEVS